MSLPRPLLFCLFATAATAVLHFLALAFFWYWLYWWFDIVIHVLGGVVVGSAALSFLGALSIPFNAHRALFAVLASAIIIGVLWEVFEAQTGIILWPDERLDSALDVLADIAGALVAFLLIFRGTEISLQNRNLKS